MQTLSNGFDDAQRSALIARLEASAAADRIKPGPLAWTGEYGSMVGCMIASDDIRQWESQLGLPQWLAVSADTLTADASVENAVDFGRQLLTAIPGTVDISTTGSKIIVRMLEEVLQDAKDVPEPVVTSLKAVTSLHHRIIGHDPVAPQEWRDARKAASAVTDALADESIYRNLAECAETAAWDAQRSSSAVNDVMRLWKSTFSAQAARDAGWTDEIDQAIHARLEEMFQVHMGGVQGPTITVFDMLKLHHPDEHETLLSRNKIELVAAANLNARARILVIETLTSA